MCFSTLYRMLFRSTANTLDVQTESKVAWFLNQRELKSQPVSAAARSSSNKCPRSALPGAYPACAAVSMSTVYDSGLGSGTVPTYRFKVYGWSGSCQTHQKQKNETNVPIHPPCKASPAPRTAVQHSNNCITTRAGTSQRTIKYGVRVSLAQIKHVQMGWVS